MVELDVRQQELLFRAGIAVLVMGVSAISFTFAFLVKENTPGIFNSLHSIAAGSLFGIGFLCYTFESIADLQGDYQLAITVSSSAYILVLVLEYLTSSSAYTYNAVSTIAEDGTEEGVEMLAASIEDDEGDAEDDDHGGEVDDEERGNRAGATEDEDANFSNAIAQNKSSTFKFFCTILLICSSLYDVCFGLLVSTEEHKDYTKISSLLWYKCLLSFSMGTILIKFQAPDRYVWWFVRIFTLASVFGILAGSYVSWQANDLTDTVTILHRFSGTIAAVSSGTLLNIATIHMMPLELNAIGADMESNNISTKLRKLVLFLVGYVLAAVPLFLFNSRL